MSYYNLKDIDFIDINVDEMMNNVISDTEELLGKKLYPGSPERIIVIAVMGLVLQNLNAINDVGKMNLLKYSRGDYLDHMAAFWDEYRADAQKAHCTMEFKTSTPLDYVNVIPQGTRVKTQDGRIFETGEPAEIPPGETLKEVVVYAIEPGISFNGIVKDQITTIVDVFPYYESCRNITETSGGMEVEDDENFREKVHESPEKLSTAGPDGAYIYWTKKADPNIGDIMVWSPSEGVVQIVPLYRDGSLPSQEVLDEIKNSQITRERRPLTDKVEVVAPNELEVSFVVKYWVNRDNQARLGTIQNLVNSAVSNYVKWQTSKLGRDIVPDKLIELMIDAGAKRVEVEGLDFTVVEPNEVVRIATPPQIQFSGLEEG